MATCSAGLGQGGIAVAVGVRSARGGVAFGLVHSACRPAVAAECSRTRWGGVAADTGLGPDVVDSAHAWLRCKPLLAESAALTTRGSPRLRHVSAATKHSADGRWTAELRSSKATTGCARWGCNSWSSSPADVSVMERSNDDGHGDSHHVLDEERRRRLRRRRRRSSVAFAAATSGSLADVEHFAPPIARKTKQTTFMHTLPSGLELEVIKQVPVMDNDEEEAEEREEEGRFSSSSSSADMVGGGRGQPAPMVFVHGSAHAAWCFAEHWLPAFAAMGHDCYAISLLGQGGSDVPDGPVAGTVGSHAENLASFIREHVRSPPILCGHSLGGLIVQSYLGRVLAHHQPPPQGNDSEASAMGSSVGGSVSKGVAGVKEGEEEERWYYPALAGMILCCSIPPTGSGSLLKRLFFKDPITWWKTTIAFIFKTYVKDPNMCRLLFFSKSIAEDKLARYHQLVSQSSKMPTLEFGKLRKLYPLLERPAHPPPVLALGAEYDTIMDDVGIGETAEFYGTKPVVVARIAHDVMLDDGWERVVEVIREWMGENELD
ncbi:hypothetical protein CBR_g51039 [Chara braunii]|uniref:AB hydrolase-1 domain-containing protein n=1 Tax=Chara braunii TaxID=69332 RepID=A0A388K5W7_CHABU|nr:hypothetical protein CBR_g51039 [Chara braunii]|eukprot:GBG65444.1 hypothetical protein CBR_g51039 [Chara braunii]